MIPIKGGSDAMTDANGASIATGAELSVRTESVQRLYLLYGADRFRVNRRYQRKLVWRVEEKQKLIDSILKDLPMPLFLVAEIGFGTDASFELIDGMQRLNALFAFLENEFSVGGEYFDLDSLADTKFLKDDGKLIQREPVLSRANSLRLVNYSVALSVFRAPDSNSIDEVFRRINSGGRRLSRQELRQAGTISSLADLVRVISSRVRGDTSPDTVIPLKAMPRLSITNRELDYGVLVDEIFWVRQGVLRREDVRTSLDEQLVLDILIDCLIEPLPSTGLDARDSYYNFAENENSAAAARLSSQIRLAIESYGRDEIERDFMRVYDEIREVLATQDARLSKLVGVQSGGRSPRYYHAIFLAIFELMFRDEMRIKDRNGVTNSLRNITAGGTLKIPSGSGNWTGDRKRTTIDAVKGVLKQNFEKASSQDDLSRYSWASELETLLSNSLVEQTMFDFKQGFITLAPNRQFDKDSFGKICCSLSAMANMGPGRVGHIVVGIANDTTDVKRIKDLDDVSSTTFRGYYVVGIEREARYAGKTFNDYWTWLICMIQDNSRLDQKLAAHLATNARIVNYHGLAVAVFRVTGQTQPTFYDSAMYERSGPQTKIVSQADYMRVFQRFTDTTVLK